MNKNIEIKVAFQGALLENNLMDVRDLAPALLALGQLFDEANRVLNGNKTQIKLQVKAHETGSFQILFNLSQSFASQISQFLTSDFVIAALNLKELIIGSSTAGVSLFWLIKKLKGSKPDKLIDLGEGLIRIQFENNTFDVPVNLLRLYQDLAIRKATEEVLRPLQREGIESFIIKEDDKVIQEVTKTQLPFFNVPILEDEKIISNESEAAYSIVSLTFKEDNKWRLFDGNSTINVNIQDEEFRKKVDQNLIYFSKGDILKCRVKTTQWRTTAGLRTEYEVLEVKEHLSGMRQLSLFDAM